MQAKDKLVEQDSGRKGSFTETGRRAQIVGAAIEVIADVGYQRASFAKIAERAGLSSTGMISYHFDGRDDLIREVLAEVVQVAEGGVRPRVEAHESYADRLRAAIEGEIELFAEYPNHRSAIVEIVPNLRGDEPGVVDLLGRRDANLAVQVKQIRKAQRAGEFGEFDPWVLVRAMRAAIDDVVGRSARDPDFDVRAAGRELAGLFDRAAKRTS